MNISELFKTRNSRLTVLSICLALAILWFLLWRTGFDRFIEKVDEVPPIVLLPLAVVYTVSWFFRGLRLKIILRMLEAELSVLQSGCVELLADLPNQFIPARLGDAVKILYMHRSGIIDYKTGTFAALMVRMMDLAAVTSLALFSALFVSGSLSEGYSSYLLASGGIMLLTGGAWVLAVKRPELIKKLLAGPLGRFRAAVDQVSERMAKSPGTLMGILGVSMSVWLFDILTLFIFMRVFSIQLTIPETAFVMLLATIAKIMPFTPNGLGVYEGMMVVILAGAGVDESTALTVAVLDHGFMNVWSFLLSVLAVYRLGLGARGAEELFRQSAEKPTCDS